MNGPQHYAEAERIAALALAWVDAPGPGEARPRGVVGPRSGIMCGALAQLAQVHATLALTATQVEIAAKDHGLTSGAVQRWEDAGVFS